MLSFLTLCPSVLCCYSFKSWRRRCVRITIACTVSRAKWMHRGGLIGFFDNLGQLGKKEEDVHQRNLWLQAKDGEVRQMHMTSKSMFP